MDASKDHSEQFESVRKSLNQTLQDRILKILLENSNMTPKQFESFLIDSVSESSLQKGNISRERPRLRTDKDFLSRGSFDRTLKQAGKNMVEAIFTVLLLGYTGLLETPQLEPFIEVGNRLKAFNELRGGRNGEVKKMEDDIVGELSEIVTSMMVRRCKMKDYISPY